MRVKLLILPQPACLWRVRPYGTGRGQLLGGGPHSQALKQQSLSGDRSS